MERRRFGVTGLLLVVLVVIFVGYLSGNMRRSGDIPYSQMRAMFTEEKVQSFIVNGERLTASLRDGTTAACELYSFEAFYDDLNELVVQQNKAGIIETYDYYADHSTNWVQVLLPYVLGVLGFILLLNLMGRMSAGGGAANDKMARFGEARTQSLPTGSKKVTFKDVAGADEEKEELEEIVQFLRDPEKYTALGAHIPKGVLLVGPPGTGKTLLAKAVAGEADVAYLSISGSDFVEMYVGVGASRVRDLFEQAKKQAPAIVFIDEIDAVGRQRGSGLGGGHDEREQTLNQLLVEMDGFDENAGIIILAATNRPDVLDPALLRPGRFDRQIVIGMPDVKAREEIFKVHTKNKPLAEDVSLEVLAKRTPGFSPADIENLVNEAALLTARRNGTKIRMDEIEEATTKVIAGPQKKSRVISEEERKLTAYHEAGHAVVMKSLPKSDPVHQITIIPRGMAGGFTMSLPEKDQFFETKGNMLNSIKHLLGGRVAEQLKLDDISTGASNDLERATQIARSMITEYGFSEKLGPVSFNSGGEVFLGKDFSTRQNYSETIASEIDMEIRSILEDSYAETIRILQEHDDALERVAQALLLVETLDGTQFEALYDGTVTPEELQAQVQAEEEEKEKRNAAEAEESARLEAERKAAEEARMEELKQSIMGSEEEMTPAKEEILKALLKAGEAAEAMKTKDENSSREETHEIERNSECDSEEKDNETEEK